MTIHSCSTFKMTVAQFQCAIVTDVSNVIAQDKSYDGTGVATLNRSLADFNGLHNESKIGQVG